MSNVKFMDREGLVQKSLKASGFRVLQLIKSVTVLVVWCVVAALGYMGVNPSSIPIEFRQTVGEFVSAENVTMGESQIPTITLMVDGTEVVYNKLGEEWVDPATAPNYQEASGALSTTLDGIWQGVQLGQPLESGTELETSSVIPRMKN